MPASLAFKRTQLNSPGLLISSLVRRWVEQLMQASARGSPSVSITEGVSNGHLLAPSPLGMPQQSSVTKQQESITRRHAEEGPGN